MHVEQALKISKNGSVTGMDSCPYELWKALQTKHKTDLRERKPGFNIIGTITLLF